MEDRDNENFSGGYSCVNDCVGEPSKTVMTVLIGQFSPCIRKLQNVTFRFFQLVNEISTKPRDFSLVVFRSFCNLQKCWR